MRSILALLVASTLLTGLPTSPRTQDDQDSKPPLSKSDRAAARKIEKRMQGAWKLVEMHLIAEQAHVTSGLEMQQIGYALVHDGYLSLEFHMRLIDKEDQDYGQSVVSGLHRFELDAIGSMETTTVIATRTRRDGSLEFEHPGTQRKYTVEFQGEKMTLTRDDGHQLGFERMGVERRRHFDIYGRQMSEDDEDGVGTGKEEGGSGSERKRE